MRPALCDDAPASTYPVAPEVTGTRATGTLTATPSRTVSTPTVSPTDADIVLAQPLNHGSTAGRETVSTLSLEVGAALAREGAPDT